MTKITKYCNEGRKHIHLVQKTKENNDNGSVLKTINIVALKLSCVDKITL